MTNILAHTDDYCAILTENITEGIHKMTSSGWELIEIIPDDYYDFQHIIERNVLLFGKGERWKN